MAFCPNCGSSVDGRFCAKCGASVNVAGDPGAAGTPSTAPSSGIPSSAASAPAGLTENAAAALCYVLGLITGILFLVLAPYNQNRLIRFHAFQSIFLHVACIVVWIAFLFVSA